MGHQHRHHHGHGNNASRKHENEHRRNHHEKEENHKEHDEHVDRENKGSKPGHCTPDQALTKDVLALLEKTTGLGDFEAWRNIWLLISKGEQDNDSVDGTFEIERNKGSLFGYASALSYDKDVRGVTMGIVGWTSKQDGPGLFKKFKELGGPDLIDLCKKGGPDLIKKVHELSSDEKFIQAQWENLCDEEGYVFETMKSFKKLGIEKPSPLAIACLLDCNLNQGFDGKFGGSSNIEKLGKHGDEKATLDKFLKWREPLADTHDFNQRPNGSARVKMFEKILAAGDVQLKDMDGLKKAMSWNMK